MEISHRVLVPGLILAWLVGSLGNAKKPAPTVDSVLAKWEEASQKCKTLDAKLTVWRYDDVFDRDHQPTITQGRFYYEAPNLGRYEIRKTPGRDERLVEHFRCHHLDRKGDALDLWRYAPCRKFSTAAIGRILSQPESE